MSSPTISPIDTHTSSTTLTTDTPTRKDRKSKSKDLDPNYFLSSSSSSSASTRQRASSNGSATSIGSHRHHHHHSKSRASKDRPDESDASVPDAAATITTTTTTTTEDNAADDSGSVSSSTRWHRHRHRSRDPIEPSGDGGAPDKKDALCSGDDDAPDSDPDFKERGKMRDSTRKRSSSNRVLPSSTVPAADPSQSQAQLRQPVPAMSSLATTSYSVTLGPTTPGSAPGSIKSGVLAMKMDRPSQDGNDDDDHNNNNNNDDDDDGSDERGEAGAPTSARSLMWHEGHFTLFQDGTFDEHVDEAAERTIFSGTVRSIRRMEEGSGGAKEVILNETRYTHFVKVLLAVPSGQGMIRQVAVDLGMKTGAELDAWVATFEACDTYILKPIKPVGSSMSSLSTLSTAKSKREAKSEWAIKKSESAQLNFLITKRGWVKYRGVMKQWSLRLFVLKPPVLIYYKDEIDESKEAASGIINLHNCNVVKRESKKDGFCFKIYALNDKHSIYASRGLKGEMLTSKLGINPAVAILRVVTQEEGLEWIRAIEEAIAYANFCQDGTFTKLISSNSLACSSGGDRSSVGNDSQLSSSPTTVPRMRPQSSQTLNAVPQAPSTSPPVPPNTVNVGANAGNGSGSGIPLAQSPTSVSPNNAVQDGASGVQKGNSEKPEKRKHDKQETEGASGEGVSTTTTTTVTITEKDVEGMASFQGLKFLEPRPTNYAVEIPREEMKIDAFEQGKNIILQLMKQVKPGMDLTKVTLPTHILEPRSFLEKMTDYFTHIELLSNAIHESDPVSRIVELTKWYISGFYIMPKTPKKPYNPIIGETFRCKWEHPASSHGPASNSFLICEQVSHHPPVSAIYAGNRADGWVINGSILFKSKFWGLSAGCLLEGYATLYVPEFNERYKIGFPSAVAKGFIVGPLTMEMFGEVTIECEESGLTSTIEFKTKPSFRGEFNCVGGTIRKGKSDVLYELSGRYDDEVFIRDVKADATRSLWKVTPDIRSKCLPRHTIPFAEQDEFASERLWDKVTKALIAGDQTVATEDKTRIENLQRKIHKDLEAKGEKWKTKLFDYDEASKEWVYKWLNTSKLDMENEIGEYDADGRIVTVLRSDVIGTHTVVEQQAAASASASSPSSGSASPQMTSEITSSSPLMTSPTMPPAVVATTTTAATSEKQGEKKKKKGVIDFDDDDDDDDVMDDVIDDVNDCESGGVAVRKLRKEVAQQTSKIGRLSKKVQEHEDTINMLREQQRKCQQERLQKGSGEELAMTRKMTGILAAVLFLVVIILFKSP